MNHRRKIGIAAAIAAAGALAVATPAMAQDTEADAVSATAEAGQLAFHTNYSLSLENAAGTLQTDSTTGIDTDNTSSGLTADVVFGFENTNNSNVLVTWASTAFISAAGHEMDCNGGTAGKNCVQVNSTGATFNDQRVNTDATLASLALHSVQDDLNASLSANADVDGGAGAGNGTYGTPVTVWDPAANADEGHISVTAVTDTDVLTVDSPYDLKAAAVYTATSCITLAAG